MAGVSVSAEEVIKYLVLVVGLFLSGCSNLLDTSFYDDNESLLQLV